LSKLSSNQKENRTETMRPQDGISDDGKSVQAEHFSVADLPPTPPHNNHSNRSEDDAPRWKKLAEISIALANLGLLAINIFLWTATKKSANAADSAAKTAVASIRPWIDLDAAVIGPLTFDNQGAHLPLVVSIQNVGHSPAVRVGEHQEFIQTLLNSDPEPWQELKRVCTQAAGESAQPANRGVTVTIFEKKPHFSQLQMTMGPQELAKTLKDIFPEMPNPPTFVEAKIIWCVGYRGDFESTTHRTGYIWEVQRKTKNGFAHIERNGDDVPKEELVLTPSIFGPLAD